MMTTDRHPRPRRFSEGVERLPDLASSARVGTFADGPATTGDDPVGTFADGLVLRPDAPSVRPAPPAGGLRRQPGRAGAWSLPITRISFQNSHPPPSRIAAQRTSAATFEATISDSPANAIVTPSS